MALPSETPSFEGAAGGAWTGDFLRAGNAFSVAAEKPLKVDPEVSFNHFRPQSARVVAEYQMVFRGLIERGRQACIYFQAVSILSGKHGLARPSVEKFSILLFVQQKEFHVAGRVARQRPVLP